MSRVRTKPEIAALFSQRFLKQPLTHTDEAIYDYHNPSVSSADVFQFLGTANSFWTSIQDFAKSLGDCKDCPIFILLDSGYRLCEKDYVNNRFARFNDGFVSNNSIYI